MWRERKINRNCIKIGRKFKNSPCTEYYSIDKKWIMSTQTSVRFFCLFFVRRRICYSLTNRAYNICLIALAHVWAPVQYVQSRKFVPIVYTWYRTKTIWLWINFFLEQNRYWMENHSNAIGIFMQIFFLIWAWLFSSRLLMHRLKKKKCCSRTHKY